MTNRNGQYVLSATDEKKIAAHARAIARKAAYDGAVEAWFDSETGKIIYAECVGLDYYASDSATLRQICRVFTPSK